jgi:epoxyqueuosine reductase QueG
MFLHRLKEQIDNLVLNSPQNVVPELGMMRIFDPPLVGVASVEDPLWNRLKEAGVVGFQHMSPQEWKVGAKSVISYFIPFTLPVRSANRCEGETATEWLYGRYEGEMFNNALRRFIVGMVEQTGARALVPISDSRFKVVDLRSNWSERHVAFIAGLGTFGLSRSLVTSVGSAGRLGSVIVDFELEPTKRPYEEFDEYCIKCGACIPRCPPLAIDEHGKDNALCKKYLNETLLRHKPRYGCGKCQTAVPCEGSNPSSTGRTLAAQRIPQPEPK